MIRDTIARSLRLHPDDVPDTATLAELGADHLDLCELANDLEDAHRVRIGVNDEPELGQTVGEVIATVTRLAARAEEQVML